MINSSLIEEGQCSETCAETIFLLFFFSNKVFPAQSFSDLYMYIDLSPIIESKILSMTKSDMLPPPAPKVTIHIFLSQKMRKVLKRLKK